MLTGIRKAKREFRELRFEMFAKVVQRCCDMAAVRVEAVRSFLFVSNASFRFASLNASLFLQLTPMCCTINATCCSMNCT